MPLRNLIAVGLLAVGAAWWLFGGDPEAEIRAAHQELVALLAKSPDQPESLSVIDLRRLQLMFDEPVDVGGDAEFLARRYSVRELLGTIVAIRAGLDVIDLRFGELDIEFPEATLAVSRFTAELGVRDKVGDELTETRQVESRMRDVDGEWLFYAFEFSNTGENAAWPQR